MRSRTDARKATFWHPSHLTPQPFRNKPCDATLRRNGRSEGTGSHSHLDSRRQVLIDVLTTPASRRPGKSVIFPQGLPKSDQRGTPENRPTGTLTPGGALRCSRTLQRGGYALPDSRSRSQRESTAENTGVARRLNAIHCPNRRDLFTPHSPPSNKSL